MENLALWDRAATVPAKYLKKIVGGRLSGKSDINPQWRYKTMTELFGPCGVGWKFTIDRQWIEPGPDGQVFAFVNISLFVRGPDGWSDPIPGTGGHFLVEKESKGLHANDEAFKMATTDALGVGMKMLGVAAEVYLGNWNGSKYITEEVGGPQGGAFGGLPAPPANARPATPKQSPKPAPSAGSRSAPTKPTPPAFSWSRATSLERRDYVLQRIATLAASPDSKAAVDQLKLMSTKIKAEDFEEADMAAIAGAMSRAEEDLIARSEGG